MSAERETRLARLIVLVAAASVLLVAVTMAALAMPAARMLLFGQPTLVPQSSYAFGDIIELDPALYRDADRNVFLFARASCSACQASKEAMASLVSELGGQPRVSITFVSSLKQTEEDREFGRELGVAPPRIVRVDMQGLRLRYVPSVVVTDRNGSVIWSHEGILTETARVEVLEVASEHLSLQ